MAKIRSQRNWFGSFCFLKASDTGRTMPGFLAKYKTVVFVNGCFWHKHEGCKYFVWPKNNAEFWKEKITGNVIRDQENYKKLCALGWRIITIWECELRPHNRELTLNRVLSELRENHAPE